MGGGPGHGGMGGGMGGGMMKPTPEMIEKMKKRYKSDPDSMPEPMREMISKMLDDEDQDDNNEELDKVPSEETVGYGGPSGSGRPSPEMMKRMHEQYKKDPDSVPAHMHDHFKRMSKRELE
jgi:2-oxoglutarate dehydrogenase complex dehydrogenase (E1) component-like enzyme